MVALENADASVDDTDLDATRMDADDAVSEVSDVNDSVTEMSDGADSASADMETLETIHDKMEESVERGEGLSPDAAEIAEVAIESICDRLGINYSRRVIPATESFGSKNSRVTSTRVAMEATQGIISKIWEAIKRAIAWVKEKVNKFLAELFTNVDRLEKHVKSVKERVKGLESGLKPEEAELDNASLARAIGSGRDANISTAKKVSDNTVTVMANANSALGVLPHVLSTITKDSDDRSIKDMTKTAAGKVKNTLPKEHTALFFGYGFSVSFPDEDILPTIEFVKEESANITDKVTALKDKGEMLEVLGYCDQIFAKFKTVEMDRKEIEKTLADFSKLVNDMEKLSDEKASKKASEMRKLQTEMSSLMTKTSVNLPSIAFKGVNALLKYVEASMANMKSKE